MPAAALCRSAFGSSPFADAGRFLSLIVGAGAMLETPGRTGGERFGVNLHGALHAPPTPESIEQLVEPGKLRTARSEQSSHRGAQPFGPFGRRAGHEPRRILCFSLSDDEARVAQGDDKPGKA